MNTSNATLIISLITVAISIGAIALSIHSIWLGQKTEYLCRPEIRIFLSDYHLEGYIEFGLEQYKKKYFLSRTKWRTLTSGASHRDNKNSLIVSCVDSWKKAHPNAEVINKTKDYKLPE